MHTEQINDLLLIHTPTAKEGPFLELTRAEDEFKYSLLLFKDQGESQGCVTLEAGHRAALKHWTALDGFLSGKLPKEAIPPNGKTKQFVLDCFGVLKERGLISFTMEPSDTRRSRVYIKMLNRLGWEWFKENEKIYFMTKSIL